MSINLHATRAALADAIRTIIPAGVTVEPRAADGQVVFPAVVLGMPSWKPGPSFCAGLFEFPVAVIVKREGTSNDDAMVAELDELWPRVLDGLLSLEDPSFGVLRAEFGLFPLQGQSYPAQIIFCTLAN